MHQKARRDAKGLGFRVYSFASEDSEWERNVIRMPGGFSRRRKGCMGSL